MSTITFNVCKMTDHELQVLVWEGRRHGQGPRAPDLLQPVVSEGRCACSSDLDAPVPCVLGRGASTEEGGIEMGPGCPPTVHRLCPAAVCPPGSSPGCQPLGGGGFVFTTLGWCSGGVFGTGGD